MINIKKFLKDNSDFEYANFNKKFISSQYEILGVRIPALRKFAKEIEPEYIELEQKPTHEEILLYGFSAGYIKSEDEQLEYLQNILPYIDNWATCDSIISALKKLNQEKSYNFFISTLYNKNEFYVRVGIVGLMRNFLKSDKLSEILQALRKVENDAYYVKMALAWFYAELCTFNFEIGKSEISIISDKFIQNKAISKANDSYRITIPQKDELSKLRK